MPSPGIDMGSLSPRGGSILKKSSTSKPSYGNTNKNSSFLMSEPDVIIDEEDDEDDTGAGYRPRRGSIVA
jgi:hypothetical protein